MRVSLLVGERVAGVLTAMLGASLLLAQVHPFGNAELFAGGGTAARIPKSIPTAARAVLESDCADCHASTVRVPVHGRFAPVSWLLKRDIVRARGRMNLSAWGSYDADKREELLPEIAEQARAGQIPPARYVLVHRDAQLKVENVAALLTWVLAENAATQAVGSAPAQGDEGWRLVPDAGRGADLFNRRCTGCHSLAQSHEGPRLAGVYGRAAASVPEFPYSAALKAAQLTWNEQTLDKWLTDPDAFVPGNNMDFQVPKPQERADLIAFLKHAGSK